MTGGRYVFVTSCDRGTVYEVEEPKVLIRFCHTDVPVTQNRPLVTPDFRSYNNNCYPGTVASEPWASNDQILTGLDGVGCVSILAFVPLLSVGIWMWVAQPVPSRWGMLTVGLGVAVLLAGAGMLFRPRKPKELIPAEGAIVDISRVGEKSSYTISVEYTTEGGQVFRADVSRNLDPFIDAGVRVGTPVSLVYDKANPALIRVDKPGNAANTDPGVAPGLTYEPDPPVAPQLPPAPRPE